MEITLYTPKGKPVAYLSEEEDHAIYTWKGYAVSYLDEDKIYGWKGKHIGWFIDGVVYDLKGYRVGFTEKTCPNATYAEPIKYIKCVKHISYVKSVPYSQPALSFNNSDIGLIDFLSQNKA